MDQNGLVEQLKDRTINSTPNMNPKIELALSWSVKGSIIQYLNQAIYFMETKKNLVMDDSCKLYDELNRSIDALLNLVDKRFCERLGIYYELSWSTRSDLMNIIMQNLEHLKDDTFTEDQKKNLIKLNNGMVVLLQNLKEFENKLEKKPIDEASTDSSEKVNGINGVNGTPEAKDIYNYALINIPRQFREIKKAKKVKNLKNFKNLKNEIATLKERLDSLDTKFNSLTKLDEKLVDLDDKVQEINRNFDQKIHLSSELLNRKLEPTQIPTEEIFEFEVKNLQKIFSTSKYRMNSDIVYCRSLPWFMVFGSYTERERCYQSDESPRSYNSCQTHLSYPSSRYEKGESYLRLSLLTNYLEKRDWQLKVDYKLEFIHPKTNEVYKSREKSHLYSVNQRSNGINRFMSLKDLKALGALDDNKCKIRLHIKAHQIRFFNIKTYL